jgi:hypothetical protein
MTISITLNRRTKISGTMRLFYKIIIKSKTIIHAQTMYLGSRVSN